MLNATIEGQKNVSYISSGQDSDLIQTVVIDNQECKKTTNSFIGVDEKGRYNQMPDDSVKNAGGKGGESEKQKWSSRIDGFEEKQVAGQTRHVI